jgi:hypothetical protein
MNVSAALLAPTDCHAAPVTGIQPLHSPEPDYTVIRHPSHGRSPPFRLEHGYAQAEAVVAQLQKDQLQGATA